MTEGPTIILVREAAAKFAGLAISGNSKIDQDNLLNKRVMNFP
jgi:hypothetical protein